MIRVQREDIDLGAEMTALTAGNHGIGGLAVFVGLVRDMVGEEALSAMTLEHYPGMTEKMLERIEAEAKQRWPLEASLIVHRYGRLEPGERTMDAWSRASASSWSPPPASTARRPSTPASS